MKAKLQSHTCGEINKGRYTAHSQVGEPVWFPCETPEWRSLGLWPVPAMTKGCVSPCEEKKGVWPESEIVPCMDGIQWACCIQGFLISQSFCWRLLFPTGTKVSRCFLFLSDSPKQLPDDTFMMRFHSEDCVLMSHQWCICFSFCILASHTPHLPVCLALHEL